MKPRRILSVIGARPQFVKVAVVARAARLPEFAALVEHRIIHTGQHYDAQMSDVFFDELEIPAPDYHLGVGSGPHGAQTGEMMKRLEETLDRERPDWLLAYGDTNSTLAGAVVAAKMHIPVAHLEAGLRSFNGACRRRSTGSSPITCLDRRSVDIYTIGTCLWENGLCHSSQNANG